MGRTVQRLETVPRTAYHMQLATLAAFANQTRNLNTACDLGAVQMGTNIGDNGALVRRLF